MGSFSLYTIMQWASAAAHWVYDLLGRCLPHRPIQGPVYTVCNDRDFDDHHTMACRLFCRLFSAPALLASTLLVFIKTLLALPCIRHKGHNLLLAADRYSPCGVLDTQCIHSSTATRHMNHEITRNSLSRSYKSTHTQTHTTLQYVFRGSALVS